MSDSLRPHGLWHTRLPCPSLSPGVCSNSSSLSWWYYLTISSSTAPFSFCQASLSYAIPIANNKAVIHEGENKSGNILFELNKKLKKYSYWLQSLQTLLFWSLQPHCYCCWLVLWTRSNNILNFVSYGKENTTNASPLKVEMPFIRLGKSPSIPSMLSFYHEWDLYLIKCICWANIMVLLL